MAGTPLYAELARQGRLKDESEFDPGEIHGQSIFNYRHPHIHGDREAEFIRLAFERDFERNGPSLMRLIRTTLAGWKRHKDHPDPRVRRRFARDASSLSTTFAAAVAAACRYYRKVPRMSARLESLRRDLLQSFGWKARLTAALGGPYVLWKMRQEQKRLAAGWTYEPPTFYESNFACEDPAEYPHGLPQIGRSVMSRFSCHGAEEHRDGFTDDRLTSLDPSLVSVWPMSAVQTRELENGVWTARGSSSRTWCPRSVPNSKS